MCQRRNTLLAASLSEKPSTWSAEIMAAKVLFQLRTSHTTIQTLTVTQFHTSHLHSVPTSLARYSGENFDARHEDDPNVTTDCQASFDPGHTQKTRVTIPSSQNSITNLLLSLPTGFSKHKCRKDEALLRLS
jgi:hypothetical protein